MPDLTARRAACHHQRDEHLVDSGRADAELAVRERPVLPLLLRTTAAMRSATAKVVRKAWARASSSPPMVTCSRTITSSAQGVEVSVTMPDKRELRAKVVGVDEATDIAVLKVDATQPAGHAVGRFVEVEGRRVGAGHRQSVSVEPDRDARHRQRDRPQPRRPARHLRGLHPDRRRDQPGELRRRARSTRAASSSASIPRSSARPAATRASASPSRATSHDT